MSNLSHNATETGQDEERKQCEQCQKPKKLSEFHRRKTKTPDGRMRICAQCYGENLEETRRRSEEAMRRGEMERQQQEQRRAEERQREREEREEQERARYRGFPDRQCIDCKAMLPALAFGYSVVVPSDDGASWVPKSLHKRCKPCHEGYRKKNRRYYPLCQVCNTPARSQDFLREYQGYTLDIIKVCCKDCIPQFEALSELDQLEMLRRVMIETYGETAYIYCLHYDEDPVHHNHIGRTKHLNRRMAEYKRDWYQEIHHYHVLEEIPFGPLSMERESRWMMYALKQGWPIDNFDMFTPENGHTGDALGRERETHHKEILVAASASIEPLTAPFEVVIPLIRRYFMNTCDARIVNWLIEQVGISECSTCLVNAVFNHIGNSLQSD